jgi:hypothetical protein
MWNESENVLPNQTIYRRRALQNKEALALMRQGNVRKRKCGLSTELNKIQDQVIRDKAYYFSSNDGQCFGKKYHPKKSI